MSLKRQTLWGMLPLLSVTAVNVLSVPLFYRFLGPETYALWFYVLTLVGTFGFMDMGLGVAVGRYIGVALGENNRSAVVEYWGTANAIALPLLAAMTAAYLLVGVVFGPKWFNVPSEEVTLLRWCFVASAPGLFLGYYSQFWLILSQAHLHFRFISIVRTGVTIAGVCLSLVLAWWTESPLVVIAGGSVFGVLQLAFFVWHGRKTYRLGLNLGEAKWARAREMAMYTGKTFAALLINSVFGSVDRLLVGRLAPAEGFSHYNICANVGSRIQGLGTAVMGPVSSNTARSIGRGERGDFAAVYNETFSFTFPWYLLISLWVTAWHPVLLRLWLGSDLSQSVAPLFTPVVVACCLMALANISGAQLSALDRVGTLLLFVICGGLVATAAVYAGWHFAGLIGVAWAFAMSRVVFVLQDLYLARLIGAGGWYSKETWLHFALQLMVAVPFAGMNLIVPRNSYWQIVPAVLHVSVMSLWILRPPSFLNLNLRKTALVPHQG